MGQMMCMEPISTLILARCYKDTVNASEENHNRRNTIVWFAAAADADQRAEGHRSLRFPGRAHMNGGELGRFENVGLR